MTFLTPFIAALALASPSPPADCSVAPAPPSAQRVFTNADLERMAACRYQTGAQSQVGAPPPETVNPWPRKTARATPEDTVRLEILEADWRARWRSTDQRVRKLRPRGHGPSAGGRPGPARRQEAAHRPTLTLDPHQPCERTRGRGERARGRVSGPSAARRRPSRLASAEGAIVRLASRPRRPSATLARL